MKSVTLIFFFDLSVSRSSSSSFIFFFILAFLLAITLVINVQLKQIHIYLYLPFSLSLSICLIPSADSFCITMLSISRWSIMHSLFTTFYQRHYYKKNSLRKSNLIKLPESVVESDNIFTFMRIFCSQPDHNILIIILGNTNCIFLKVQR